MSKDIILKSVSTNLKELLQNKSEALPKNFNQTRWLQNCLTVLSDTNGIEKCDIKSIARTMLKGAFLGLDFFNKECYAIAYGGQLQFQTDYKGEVKLCKIYSINRIKDIYAKIVRKGDVFEEKIQNGRQFINFTPKSFNDEEIIGVFAIVYYMDESMAYETMTIKEVNETRRNFSKMPDGKAWKNSFGEMCKKTILRRLCKMIELNFDHAEQDKAFQDGGDFQTIDVKAKKMPIADPFKKEPESPSKPQSSENAKEPEKKDIVEPGTDPHWEDDTVETLWEKEDRLKKEGKK